MLVDAAATCLPEPKQFDVMRSDRKTASVTSSAIKGAESWVHIRAYAIRLCGGQQSLTMNLTELTPDIAEGDIANPYSMLGSVAT